MSSATDPESIVNEYVASIQPAFVVLLANTAFSASLFTLFVVLLALSTKESRRRVVFRLNVLAICIVLTMGVLVGFGDGKIVLNKLDQLSQATFIASMTFTVFPPLLSDSILLTRLLALYPLSSTRPVTLLKIFTFPLCIKSARVVVLTLFVNGYANALRAGSGNPWFRNPNLIAEWTMQIADNAYSVSFFLYNLRIRTSSIKRGGLPARIRQIFYISAANFVFPLMFNIVLIICSTTDSSYTLGVLLLLINNYVTVMGVLCATVWFSRSEWVQTRSEPSSGDMLTPELGLRRPHDGERTFGNEIVMVGKGSATSDTRTWTVDR
ncbi:hypothetical protein PISMIDRAFT_671826 [Pisolithus microcarpus 441]|uniref:G-protein coupled receptors family 1 profile domain-containing protein n=1 Tax=Pisolithus microcarpus 441 TaxID=765257 RepID=A0A0C9ZKH1_9AGAM|nr:hypothetical protein BKA83DRAFT_671826 [Pisolithus microcarpus]KIK29861.1 hypothetical protein PISMIDRAFT_671826 [Pisolithus microcarpus 441]